MTTLLAPERPDRTPSVALDLVDAGQAAGWIDGDIVGFGGFADDVEAAHAAWVAYRTLMRRLAQTHGLRPLPVDAVPLALERHGGRTMILANGRPIAELLLPDAASRSGPERFGFELRVPPPADELRVHAMAHLMYRTLRKSGLRWAMWRPGNRSVPPESARSQGDGAAEASRVADDTTNDGGTDVTARVQQRSRRIPALPWQQAGRPGRGREGGVLRVRQR